MIKLYLRWIRQGRMTPDQVPVRWREAVLTELEESDAES